MPVMADQEKSGRTGGPAQHFFQPENALDIKMVRGLIHDKHVRSQHHCPADRQPFPPPARQVLHRRVAVSKFSTAEQGIDPVVFFRIDHILSGQPCQQIIADTFCLIKDIVLGQITETHEFLTHNLPTIRLFQPADNFQ